MTEHFSQSGAPILRGTGLQSVHEKIRAAFEVVRVHAEIDIGVVEDKEIDGMISEVLQLVEIEEQEVELIELDEEADAEACLRDAARAVQQQAGRENDVGVYHIRVPTEDAAMLIEQALCLV